METGMNNISGKLRMAAVVVLGGLSLSACATKSYVDAQIADVNNRISAVDAKAGDARQRADAAGAAAAAANTAAGNAAAAADAAANDARNANQRLDQVTTRVDTLEQQQAEAAKKTRRPRG
jgi:small-conductance mechanosensitive channel